MHQADGHQVRHFAKDLFDIVESEVILLKQAFGELGCGMGGGTDRVAFKEYAGLLEPPGSAELS